MVKNFLRNKQLIDEEIEASIYIDKLKNLTKIDRSETCFAGKGEAVTESLTPMPSVAERLRNQEYL